MTQLPRSPHAGVQVEVRAQVARVVRVVPEAHGHRRHRLGDHHLAELADHLAAVRIERLDIGAQTAARDLAVVDRLQEAAGDERAADVGAAAAVEAQDVGAELLVDVVVALARQRRAGEAERADAAEVEVVPEPQAGLAAGHEEGRTDPHEGGPGLLGQPPLEREVRPHRVAVDHHDRGAREQRGDERVPHHPGGGREPQQAPAGLEVPAQADALEVLDQLAAMAVDDRLRQAGGAGGEQDVDRVVEGDGLEGQGLGLREQLVPGGGIGYAMLAIGHLDDAFEARQSDADLGDVFAAVGRPVAVGVARDGQQDLRRDLAEAPEDAARAELGGAGRPDRAEARGGQEGDERLGDVRQVGDDAVAGAHAERS